MKKLTKKLVLDRETVRSLDRGELPLANGASPPPTFLFTRDWHCGRSIQCG